MKDQKALREHVVNLLNADSAHASFDAAVKNLSAESRGKKPKGAEHTPWQLLEHLRIAQWDIVEFTRNPKHKSPDFPAGYWPVSAEPPDAKAWDKSVASFRADLKTMEKIVADESTDLLAPLAHGDGQTVLREALLLADHNAYHIGQLILLRRLLDEWK
jgi:hypothetical protein